MTTLTAPRTAERSARTFGDLLQNLGEIPADRILLSPAPGTATESDVLRLADAADKSLCELIDEPSWRRRRGSPSPLWRERSSQRFADLFTHGISVSSPAPTALFAFGPAGFGSPTWPTTHGTASRPSIPRTAYCGTGPRAC